MTYETILTCFFQIFTGHLRASLQRKCLMNFPRRSFDLHCKENGSEKYLCHKSCPINEVANEILLATAIPDCFQICEGLVIELTLNWNFKKWSLGAVWLLAAGTYPGFCSTKRLGVFLLPLNGMLVHRRSLPRNLLGFPNNLPIPICTPGWRETLLE